MNPDIALFHLINGRGTWIVFDAIMPVISNLKYFIPFLVLLVAWMLVRDGLRGRITVLCLLVLVPVTDQLSSSVLKPAFGRPRPCRPEAGLENVVVRARCSSRGAFPSSHASNIGAVAMLLGWRYRRAWWAAALTAFLVGYSRVYLGVHYPTDVVGGWILGGLLGAGIAYGGGRMEQWWAGRGSPAPTGD